MLVLRRRFSLQRPPATRHLCLTMHDNLREFVYYRHPGPRCAWEGGVRASVFDTTSVSPASPAPSSKNIDFAAIYATLALARSPNRACHPMGPHMDPLWGPRRSKWTPKVSQDGKRGPKSTRREPKGDQKSRQKRPNGIPAVAQDGQREPRRAQLYKQTPDQPPKRPLC